MILNLQISKVNRQSTYKTKICYLWYETLFEHEKQWKRQFCDKSEKVNEDDWKKLKKDQVRDDALYSHLIRYLAPTYPFFCQQSSLVILWVCIAVKLG